MSLHCCPSTRVLISPSLKLISGLFLKHMKGKGTRIHGCAIGVCNPLFFTP